MNVRRNRYRDEDPNYPTILETSIMLFIVAALALVVWQLSRNWPVTTPSPDCSLCHAPSTKPFDAARVKTKRPHAQTDKERLRHARALIKELEEASK